MLIFDNLTPAPLPYIPLMIRVIILNECLPRSTKCLNSLGSPKNTTGPSTLLVKSAYPMRVLPSNRGRRIKAILPTKKSGRPPLPLNGLRHLTLPTNPPARLDNNVRVLIAMASRKLRLASRRVVSLLSCRPNVGNCLVPTSNFVVTMRLLNRLSRLPELRNVPNTPNVVTDWYEFPVSLSPAARNNNVGSLHRLIN